MSGLGIYIHIPFCRRKCEYCDFYSIAGYHERQMDGYLEALILQINEFFATAGRHTADTVYIGGGTPSIFGGKRLQKLLKALEKRIPFGRMAEITVEINPESADEALFRTLKKAGVNRISMGVQSGDDGELTRLGRLHTFEQARRAAELCRQHCTANLSVDLMYGLPRQTMEGWEASLRQVIALEPRHISCYGLKVEEGTPLFAQNPILPDEDEQADLYLKAIDLLTEHGYEQYEISNFAKPGFASRHNSRYWDLSDYVGFGCAAHSYYMGKRYSYINDVEAYIARMKNGGIVVDQADQEPFFNRYGEYIMLRLRTNAGLSQSDFSARFKTDFASFAQRLEAYIPTGHVVREGDRYSLTPTGFLISNRIIGDVIEGCIGEDHFIGGGGAHAYSQDSI